jgi:hypothetical protein
MNHLKRPSNVSPINGHATTLNAKRGGGGREGAPAVRGGKGRRPEPNPLGGNFILMPSLLEYLSPDLTLPEQYFMRQRNDDGMGAEKSLMYAVLKDGIRCFYKHVGATRRKYRKMSIEAEEWILDDSYDYAFGFRVICEMLDIDADCLRRRLLEWKESELRRREHTGDTKTIQVGRSPFPTPIDGLELDSADGEEEEVDDEVADADDAGDKADDQWSDVEHMSLEELRLEEHDRGY